MKFRGIGESVSVLLVKDAGEPNEIGSRETEGHSRRSRGGGSRSRSEDGLLLLLLT